MTNYSVENVDEYIADAPQVAQAHLREIRAAVKSAIPQAEEKIGYGKPYYKHHRWVVGYDVYKQHIGFEIWDGQLTSEIRQTLEEKGYKTGSKTFQIRYDQPVPTAIIKKLAQEQAKAEEEKARTKKK
ncbi:MAG TPA: DUF1801 domain-containing protein [Patescibacteria group bacterium]